MKTRQEKKNRKTWTGSVRRVPFEGWGNASAGSAQPHLLFQRSREPGRAGAAQDGTYHFISLDSRSSIIVYAFVAIKDESRVRHIAKGPGAKVQLVERIERAVLTSPVFVHEHLTAADVVRPMFNVFETVGLTHCGTKCLYFEGLV